VVNTTPIAAPGSIRPSRRIASISATETSAAPAAPSSIGSAETRPVSRKATTMPGSATWLIASPISACRRRIRKVPRQRAGDGRQRADQDRRQRELDKGRRLAHHPPRTGTGPPRPAVEIGDLVRGEHLFDRGQPVIAPGQPAS
jgi:hypothetical protein